MWYAIAVAVLTFAAGYVAGRIHAAKVSKPRPLPPHLRHPRPGDKDYLIDGGDAG